ncbi:MAG TPA: Ig-like domain-containing protein [Gemmatimonadales bacterium]|jgi:alpha-tubulin suppressor-like RCC1 family protein
MVLALFGITACGGGDDGGSNAPPAPVASVTIIPSTLPLTVGETQQLTAVLRNAAGTELTGRTVTWTTSDATVATVSTSGLVSALSTGSATIEASSEGQTGTAAVTVAAPIPTRTFVAFTAGGAHTCALTAEGAAYCWGRGESGQLGAPAPSSCPLDPGVFPCALAPVAVGGGLTFEQITGGGSHTCGLTVDGTAYCWGSNTSGQLGNNSTTQSQVPVPVATELHFDALDAGANHTCGVTSGGASYCWGLNDRGQLGDGTTTNRTVPVAVSGGLAFEVLTAGGFNIGHTCGVVTGGAAYCWGDNEQGQLGMGSADVDPHALPTAVSGGLAFVSLTAGLGRHTCGLLDTGAAYCWGENTFGALGDGSTIARAIPVPVSGGLGFTDVKAGGFIGHTCGFTDTGAAYCWGENERGQVGDGTTIDRSLPSAVAGGLSFADLEAGFRHTCALTTSGTLYCWGSGAAGQLGINSTSQRNAPAKVLGQP